MFLKMHCIFTNFESFLSPAGVYCVFVYRICISCYKQYKPIIVFNGISPPYSFGRYLGSMNF